MDIGGFQWKAKPGQAEAHLLFAVFAAAKYYVWMWLLKPLPTRPPLTRHNLSLGLIDLTAVAALVGGFFILLNLAYYQLAFLWMAGLLLYNYLLRTWRINSEVRRLLNSSKKWKPREAYRHVRLQVRTTYFQ